MAISPPNGLHSLVASYAGTGQAAVLFPAASWTRALEGGRPGITRFLHDIRYTESDNSAQASDRGRRTITRAAIRAAIADIDMQDSDEVLAILVLVMAWGYGIRSSARGIGNTRRAVTDQRAHYVLSVSADRLRGAVSIDDCRIAEAYADFRLSGIRRSFFTKWFAFAGYSTGRSWQPLILDDRVYRTLNKTLGVTTTDMAAGSRNRAARYAAYVDHLHSWAESMTCDQFAVDAEWLEWILFAHNGGSLP
jgi:hypothetical protein